MTKAPIDPADIRKGDLIRWEMERREDAYEYRADKDGEAYRPHRGAYYLLDRPKPPVDLPTEPTLGWLSWRDQDPPAAFDSSELSYWYLNTASSHALSVDASVPIGMVTKFTPATAVPTEALDDLRHYRAGLDYQPATPTIRRIDKFLSATDEANA